MRCGECGREIEDGSRYCPWCGATSSFIPSDRRGGRKRTAMLAAFAVVALVIVAAFIASMDYDRTDDRALNPQTQPDGGSTVVFTDGVYYVSGEDAELFDFELTESDGVRQLVVTLDESVASQYGSFTWYVNDESKWPWGYQQIEKTEPVLYWTLEDDTVGDFSVGVVCRESSGFPSFFPVGGTEYSVEVSIDGTYVQQYSWTYLGESYQLSVDYTYSDFIEVSGSNGASLAKRMGYGNGTYSVVTDFVTVDETVTEMEQGLSELYLGTYGAMDDAGYAEFILAFVQTCFGYTYDSVLYGQQEYYAFPLETIHNGGGDCEDTSILCAALYEAAGYDAGVFIIPGHAIAAIALDGFTPAETSVTTVSAFSFDMDGKTYYGCETTLDYNTYGIGWISSDYAITADGTVYYQGEAYRDQGYGLYAVTEKD